jgi:predicted Zn finger-like uncharacterized protein
MLIVCTNCSTSYRIEATSVGARGRSVRCARCRTVWFVDPPGEIPELRAPEASTQPAPPAERSTEPTGDEAVAAFRSELGADTPPSPPPEAQADQETEPAAEPPPATAEAASPPETTPPPDDAAEGEPAPPAVPEQPERPVALSDIPIPLQDSPPLAPMGDDGRAAIENSPQDIERAALRRQAQRQTAKRGARPRIRLPVVIAMLAVACAALLALRKDVVRHMPQMASFYATIGMPVNLRGLIFTDLKVGRETHDGVAVLVVEGAIVNGVSTPVDVPRLRFALRNAAGAEIYSWTAVPTQSTLEPAERLPFRSRLASPPDDGQDVQVRFFTRRDAGVGMP